MFCSLHVYGIIICILLSITFSRSYICDLGLVNCTCQDLKNQTKVDCSHKELFKIPKFYENSTWIDLSDNLIEKIENNFPKNVEYINLSRNKIKRLNNFSFHGLQKLKTLNLDYNHINISQFYKGIFPDLKSLIEISLKGNTNPSDNVLIRDDAFSELTALRILKIDGPRNISFEKGFLKLTELIYLDLSGITGNCSFYELSKDLFKYLPHLTYIDVSACDILDIEDGAFENLSFLQYLDLSHNKRIGFASLPNITKNLNQTPIEILRLNGINCLTGIGTKILTRHFINLKETNLTELYIEKNRLEQLEAGAMKVLPKTLKKVSVGENKLTQGKYILDYFSMDSVRIFNISVQLRPAPYPMSIFENCKEKDDNCEFPFSEKKIQRDTTIYKDVELIDESFFRTKDKGFVIVNFPKSLEIIYANSSRLYSAIPEFGITSRNLREVYLQNNFFYSWIGPIHGIQNLTILDLSNNFCSYISESFFKYATGVKILNLSRNDIGKHIIDDSDGRILENLYSLRELDLSFDNINVLPSLMFKNLQNLQVLNLNGNLLSEWRVKMDHMRNIKDIKLAKNRLTTIDVIQQRSFETLFLNSKLTVDLSDNKLSCSCENLQFLSWITTYRIHFKHFELYQCSLASSKIFNFSEAVSSVGTLREKCRSLLSIYILISVSIAFLISMVLGVTMVKLKWKILYLIFRAKKVFKKRGTSAMQVGSSYDYQAYISYYDGKNHDMYQFATGDIVEHIETQLNIELFIPGRNDAELAGRNKYNIVTEGMAKSRRVICLVTEEYLTSGMWKFDLKVAMDIGVERGENYRFIHIILFPGVNKNELTEELLIILNYNSSLDYPDEAWGYDLFWEDFKNLFEPVCQDIISETRQNATSELELENHCDTEQLLTPEIE
ncbi:toll-like receptor 4 [Saccostrea cucullata]|uniref:toll-like receptor 4 n=1 Tax=Saccostrea cuccullata TaxID=36930 RepID=UPI002ED51B3D